IGQDRDELDLETPHGARLERLGAGGGKARVERAALGRFALHQLERIVRLGRDALARDFHVEGGRERAILGVAAHRPFVEPALALIAVTQGEPGREHALDEARLESDGDAKQRGFAGDHVDGSFAGAERVTLQHQRHLAGLVGGDLTQRNVLSQLIAAAVLGWIGALTQNANLCGAALVATLPAVFLIGFEIDALGLAQRLVTWTAADAVDARPTIIASLATISAVIAVATEIDAFVAAQRLVYVGALAGAVAASLPGRAGAVARPAVECALVGVDADPLTQAVARRAGATAALTGLTRLAATTATPAVQERAVGI